MKGIIPEQVFEHLFNEERMDIISQNGNDGIAYTSDPYSAVQKEDIEMQENGMKRCSPAGETFPPTPICFGTGRPVDDDGMPATDDTCMDCPFLHQCAAATAEANLEKRAEDNGLSGSHYELPEGCTELKHLIWYKDMNAQVGEAFRKLYRLGEGDRNSRIRDLNGVIAYCEQEKERIEMYGDSNG
jgi:hypothetical protein